MYKAKLPAPNLSKVLRVKRELFIRYFEEDLIEILDKKKEFDEKIKAKIYDLCIYCYMRGTGDIIDHIIRIENSQEGDFGDMVYKDFNEK